MSALEDVLHTVNAHLAKGRRVPFAICVAEPLRQALVNALIERQYGAGGVGGVLIPLVRDLRIRGVRIGIIR